MPITVQLNKAKTFLDRILEKLPEAEREAVRSEYSAAQDEVAGAARELDGMINTVNARAAAQKKWWEDHGVDPATGQPKVPAADPTNRITAAVDTAAMTREFKEEIARTADNLAAQGLFLSTKIPTLIAQHGVEFGEVLDGEKLVNDAIKAQKDVTTYYAESVAERRKTKAEEKRTAELTAAEQRGRDAAMKEFGSRMPYPTTRGIGPTTLAGLQKPADNAQSQYTLDAAVATAQEVMTRQGGS